MSSKIELGDVVRDSITGFQGVVIGTTQWIHGCIRLTIQPQELKDGRPIEVGTFDEPQLVLVTKAAIARGNPKTGGPIATPSRRSDVKR
jgi:hypothetical protein